MKYLGIDRRSFLTFITSNEFDASEDIKIVGQKIEIDDKYVFNGIVKKDLIPDIQNDPQILKII